MELAMQRRHERRNQSNEVKLHRQKNPKTVIVSRRQHPLTARETVTRSFTLACLHAWEGKKETRHADLHKALFLCRFWLLLNPLAHTHTYTHTQLCCY